MKNTIFKEFYINDMNDYDYNKLILDYVKSFDAYQNLLFIWGGDLSANGDTTGSHEDVTPTTVNIRNSELKRSGGPAMILQHADASEPESFYSGVIVNIDEYSLEKIDTALSGQEAWFIKVNAVAAAQQIVTMDQIISGYSAIYNNQSTFLKDNYLNILSVGMINAFGPSDLTYAGCKDVKVTVNVVNENGEKIRDITNTSATYAKYNPILSSGAPFFISSGGGAAYLTQNESTKEFALNIIYNDYLQAFDPAKDAMDAPEKVAAYQKFFSGDTLILYINGMAVPLRYYHNATAA